jgi:N-acetyl-anhydromuramyl-L-alanine amidase AmpD
MTILKKWQSPNYNKGRGGWKPDIIVCHISEGYFESGCEWLCNPKAQASAHFFVGRDGRVAQLVDIENIAWGNGTTSKPKDNRYSGYSNVEAVRLRGGSANNYTISIEHEGKYAQTRGALTEAQTEAAAELIQRIRQDVKRIYGIDIPADRQHIVGHCDIAPRWKPCCPGELYPFDAIIRRLADEGAKASLVFTGAETADISIIAAASVNVEQMRTWARGKKAEEFFVDLADQYYAKCAAIGIDPAIAYAQAALETGYGRFGSGIIDASYHNLCGMKVTNGGGDYDPEAHQRFTSWDEGVQAHIDHLALYAGSPGYPKPKAKTPDPRHFTWVYGTGRTLRTLKGWASDVNYVTKLEKLITELRGVKAAAVNAVKVDKPSEWANEAWSWAREEGLLDGSRPGDRATREEIAAITYRLYKRVLRADRAG